MSTAMTTTVELNMMKMIRKEISKNKGSPCITCLVRSTCTRDLEDKTVCPEYINFILNEVLRCKNEVKS